MLYYDRISSSWHRLTGRRGGAFKRLVLNDFLISLLPDLEGLSILELGAGNGYFLASVLRRSSGRSPRSIVITDISPKLIALAEKHHRVVGAEYQVLITVTHPWFIESLDKRGELKQHGRGQLTMPGAGGLRLPVVRRSEARYESLIAKAGFDFVAHSLETTEEVLREKPGLRKAGPVPLGLVFDCRQAR